MEMINTAINNLFLVFSLPVALIGFSITNIAKGFLPDKIEQKWMPVISMVVCSSVTLIPQFNANIVTGLLTGCLISGGFSGFVDFLKDVAKHITKGAKTNEQPQ